LGRGSETPALADRQLVLPQPEVLRMPVPVKVPTEATRSVSRPQPNPEHRLRLAVQTKQQFVERVTMPYEQGAAGGRIGKYVRRWLMWLRSGGLERVWDTFVGEMAEIASGL
jgi:hypothetical protein